MIDFNKNSVFNLTLIDNRELNSEIRNLLTPGEQVIATFKTVRDQLAFTSKRIISADSQGITGTRKSFSSLPYSKVQFFSIQIPGMLVRPDKLTYNSEMFLYFTNGFVAEFDFKANVNIFKLCNTISQYIL